MFKFIKNDIPASVVVFFVALPLCLGIALASGTGVPPLAGLLAGIIGGSIVGLISKSNIGVSGPAAGLAAIVASSITSLGSFDIFLVAVILSGFIQILLGALRFGVIGYFFPNAVIKGMLTGIGIIIILKQIPHFFGYDAEPEGADSFIEQGGETTFSMLSSLLDHVTIGSTCIGILALVVILFWDSFLAKKHPFFKLIQGSLIAVVLGIVFQFFLGKEGYFEITSEHLVQVPIPESTADYFKFLTFPDFKKALNHSTELITIAFTLALVASLETLLSVEATDKLDPEKNVTPANRELFAQGIGNIISGFVGGLPITQVIVRSSANVQANAKTKLSAILHGILLMVSVLAIPHVLNLIPKSVLASILLLVGYKLAKPSLFKELYQLGWKQFIPFLVTVIVIVFKDLLWGIFIGLGVSIVVILIKSYQNSHFLKQSKDQQVTKMTLAEEVTFLNKATIREQLNQLTKDSTLELNIQHTRYLDYDVIEILEDFRIQAKNKNITIRILSESGITMNPESMIDFFKSKINN